MSFPITPDLAAIEQRAQALWDRTRVHEFDPAGAGEVFSVDTPINVGATGPAGCSRRCYRRQR